MNPKRLQAAGMTLGVALFVATGLLTWTGADHPVPVKAQKSASNPPTGVAGLQSLGDTFANVSERVKPCVVSVYSAKIVKMRQPDFFSPFGEDFPFRFFFEGEGGARPRRPGQQPRQHEFRQDGMGSGIIVDKEGRILTNNHVVDGTDEIKVTLSDKRTFEAEIVGKDSKTDLAVIKIKGSVPSDLPVAELGDSEEVRVGDWVLAIGAPFGYVQTVTAGIISAKGRTTDQDMYQDFLQTDAAINPGNSGGPLVNLQGEVIGINSAIATRVGQFAGVGFAIPSNLVKAIYPTLAKGGKISRGMLGVIIQDVTDELAKQFNLSDTYGAIVSQVNKGSPAEKAEIKPGDVIIKYNGKRVEDTAHLRTAVANTAPGTKVELVILRDGKERAITAKLGELTTTKGDEDGPEESSAASDLGLTVEPLTAAKAKELGYEKGDGLLVTEVQDNSSAALAGVQPGDLITEVNRSKVSTTDEFRDSVAKAKTKESVLLLVKRQGASRFIIIKMK